MELVQAYELLKEKYENYNLAVYQENRAKPRFKKKYHEEVNKIENEVWHIFQLCPELNNYVPFEDEFFTSFFCSDFERLMQKLEDKFKTQE